MIASAAVAGFATGFSLILAIGAQNAFVLRQGLIGRHVVPLCLLCATSDAVLIVVGVAGFATVAQRMPWLGPVMTLAGAGFLIAYGTSRLAAAWRGTSALAAAGGAGNLSATLATGAAFTWLNPHVYLDTLGLIGAVSVGWEGGHEKAAFGAGAVAASFVFFFSLGLGARRLAPLMARPGAWQVLDTGIGVTLLALAAALLATLA